VSALPWFRFYKEAIDDAKLNLLAPDDRWYFVALLCCKAQGLLDDRSALGRRKVCFKMRLDSRELGEVLRRLAEVELIELDTMEPLHWEKRQARSDSSADRVAAFRERKKEAQPPAAGDQPAEHVARDCNVTPTLPSRPCNLLEEEGEEEGEERKNTGVQGGQKLKASGHEKHAYTEDFDHAWALYPKRPGANKLETFKAWCARLKAGAPPEDMIAGTRRYALFCTASKTEPQYIKQPATFFGPNDHFLQDWTPPSPVATPPGNRAQRGADLMENLRNLGDRNAAPASDYIDV
jgi:hypothetical protein